MAIPHPHPSPSKLEPMDWLFNSQPTDRSVIITLKQIISYYRVNLLVHSRTKMMKINLIYLNALVNIKCSSLVINQLNHRKGSSFLRQCLIWATKITLQSNSNLQFLVHAHICFSLTTDNSNGKRLTAKFKYNLIVINLW